MTSRKTPRGTRAADQSVVNIRTRRPLTERQLENLRRGNLRGQEVAKQRKAARGTVAPSVAGEPTRWERLRRGEIKVEDLDWQELARGQCRNIDGTFAGRPPAVPPKLARAMQAEIQKRIGARLDGALDMATRALVSLIRDPLTPPAERLRAIGMVMDRRLGKPTETVKVAVSTFDELVDEVTIRRDVS